MNLPKIMVEEVGLREGLQSNTKILSFLEKVKIVDGFIASGLRRIQLGSFVSPKLVPQMVGVEELFNHYADRGDVEFSALILNRRGLDRAQRCGVKRVCISISASDSHQRRNTGRSIASLLPEVLQMVTEAKQAGLTVQASVQAVFGCHLEGPVPPSRIVDICQAFQDRGADEISLADTAGFATPGTVRDIVRRVWRAVPGAHLGLHLHNTLGMGFANVMSALAEGVTLFDSAIGGLGGCPFMEGAEGNIATEDLVFLLQSIGAAGEINLERLCRLVNEVRQLFGTMPSGKICAHHERLVQLELLPGIIP